MDTNDTLAVDLRGRCCLCLRILSSEVDTRGSLASTRICANCNLLFSEEQTSYNNSLESVGNMLSQQFQDLQPTISNHVDQSRPWMDSGSFDSVRRDAYESDSDASVDVDTVVNHDDGDDGNDEIEAVGNMGGSLVGRIQLHRSLATNGRNRPNDWLSEILSDEGIRNSERRRLFGILEDQVLETSGYREYVDVDMHGSRLGAAPAAIWFVTNLERVVVDDTGLVCVICKDDVCVGSVVNRLPCGHVYHPSCIVPWLNARNTCPLCRYELPTDDKDRRHHESEVRAQGALAESGGGRWWFLVAPVVSVVGIVVVWWLGGGVFGGQRDDRSTRWWSLFCK